MNVFPNKSIFIHECDDEVNHMELAEHSHETIDKWGGQNPTPKFSPHEVRGLVFATKCFCRASVHRTDRTLAHVAMRWLWAFGVMLIGGLAACSPTQAHPEGETLPTTMAISELVAITAGEAISLSIAPGGVYVSYDGEGPTSITVTPLEESDPPLDVVITVLDSDWQQVTYHDGNSSGEETIARLDLGNNGPFVIWVNSFNGLQAGRVELEVANIDVAVLALGVDPLVIDLLAGEVARVMLEGMDAGPYRIAARSLTDERDVRLALVDAEGTIIASNDDHEGVAADISQWDAALVFEPDAGGPWMLEIREYLGRAAQIEVSIEPDAQKQEPDN